VLVPNASFLALLLLLSAVSVLPLVGVADVWTSHRFTSVRARVLWTVALALAGLPALVGYVVVVRWTHRLPLAAA